MLGQGGKVRHERDAGMSGGELGPFALSGGGELRLGLGRVGEANVGTEFHNNAPLVAHG